MKEGRKVPSSPVIKGRAKEFTATNPPTMTDPSGAFTWTSPFSLRVGTSFGMNSLLKFMLTTVLGEEKEVNRHSDVKRMERPRRKGAN